MHSKIDGDIRSEPGQVPRWIQKALHDLCQPLTALECRLYLSTLSLVDEQAGGMLTAARAVAEQERLSLGVQEALAECGRMMTIVRSMQERMALQEHGADWNEGGAGDERFTERSSERSADSSAIGGTGERRRRVEEPSKERFDWSSLDRE